MDGGLSPVDRHLWNLRDAVAHTVTPAEAERILTRVAALRERLRADAGLPSLARWYDGDVLHYTNGAADGPLCGPRSHTGAPAAGHPGAPPPGCEVCVLTAAEALYRLDTREGPHP